MPKPYVAGVDSSTQSCKVLIYDPSNQSVVREGRAKHPDGTEVNPEAWWSALLQAIESAGGIADVSAISIAGQQHGMVLLDYQGNVVRDALLWNDTRSAPQAIKLIEHFGADWLAQHTGSLPVASFTATKLLWVKENEPEILDRVAAVCLPHDYLSWRLSENYPDIGKLFTDRSDASGTGYFNPATDKYLSEVIEFCLGKQVVLPKVLGPREVAAQVRSDIAKDVLIGPGMGDNAGAAKGLELTPGGFAVSIGTSGTIFGSLTKQSADPSGAIAGFADADGNFLPLVCTLNAARVLEWGAALLGTSLDEFGELGLHAEPGAGGVKVIPYLEGERTPNLPNATAEVLGITLKNGGRENFARACIEGMLNGLAFGARAITEQGHQIQSIQLIGGAAANRAVQQIAAEVFAVPVTVPAPGEYVALGAAKQAAGLDI
ncbi:MAG: xylulokinase [Actinobacteria bacterium]|nr:xylulokinase [Actinomycetota bacterium]